ncbi:hypothetical protein NDU88_001808 [Pleurodeles waltl]|uniref:Uncharacterized protein n=1 Tax=Pleurodeles waltl TaxID=8319 RepID=A0AAV7T1J6_PLEWA|nr:hypothetical protein NDU88_001808 [Pleurodeles waltl]
MPGQQEEVAERAGESNFFLRVQERRGKRAVEAGAPSAGPQQREAHEAHVTPVVASQFIQEGGTRSHLGHSGAGQWTSRTGIPWDSWLAQAQAYNGYLSSEMEDLTRLHASLLNALHTSTTALNMQSDKLDLQMDLMKVMAIHIADINRKLELLDIRPLEQISSQQQAFCNCGPVIDKLSTLPTILTEILQKVKKSNIVEATFNTTSHDSGDIVRLQKTPGLAASSPTKEEANTQGIYSISTDESSQLKEIVPTNSECTIERSA